MAATTNICSTRCLFITFNCMLSSYNNHHVHCTASYTQNTATNEMCVCANAIQRVGRTSSKCATACLLFSPSTFAGSHVNFTGRCACSYTQKTERAVDGSESNYLGHKMSIYKCWSHSSLVRQSPCPPQRLVHAETFQVFKLVLMRSEKHIPKYSCTAIW